jgi:hypothetical protein
MSCQRMAFEGMLEKTLVGNVGIVQPIERELSKTRVSTRATNPFARL